MKRFLIVYGNMRAHDNASKITGYKLAVLPENNENVEIEEIKRAVKYTAPMYEEVLDVVDLNSLEIIQLEEKTAYKVKK